METGKGNSDSLPILDYRGRTPARLPGVPWAHRVVRVLCLAQIPALVVLLVWATFWVGPVLPKTTAFDVVPLAGGIAPAVASLSREHSFPAEQFEQLVWLLGSAGSTILNGPASATAAAPERLDVLAFHSNDGVTWIELPRGWIEVGKGMIAFWPNTGGWYLLHVYDADAAWRDRGWGGDIHDANVFYTDLPEGFVRASSSWAIPGGGRGHGLHYNAGINEWQSPLLLRVAIIAISLVGLWLNVANAHKMVARRQGRLAVWAGAMCIVTLLGAWTIRPATEFFVVPGSREQWLSWQPCLLIPCAIGLGVVAVMLSQRSRQESDN